MYLLAQVRKLIERENPQPVPFALKMYCHWALHVDLTGLDTTKGFLIPIDALIVNTIAGFTPDPAYKLMSSDSLFRDLIFLETFRSQLKDFLLRYGLPSDLCDIEASWFGFLEAYAGLIEDGSLSIQSTSSPLNAVKKVVFTKGGNPIAADSLFTFVIQWDVVLNDDRIFRMGFEAKRGGRALSFGGHLIAAPVRPSAP